MENLTTAQADILAHAIATAWDETAPTEEQEFGPKTEAKANETLLLAFASAEVKDAGITLDDQQRADLLGQFHVYLQAADGWGDISRMEAELAELFAAE